MTNCIYETTRRPRRNRTLGRRVIAAMVLFLAAAAGALYRFGSLAPW